MIGKPPKSGQFAKGRSGNPAGRPREPSLKSLLKRQLDEMVDYRENGVRNRASKKSILIARVTAEGLTGGVRERQQLLDLIIRAMPEELQDEPSAALSKDRQPFWRASSNALARGRTRLHQHRETRAMKRPDKEGTVITDHDPRTELRRLFAEVNAAPRLGKRSPLPQRFQHSTRITGAIARAALARMEPLP